MLLQCNKKGLDYGSIPFFYPFDSFTFYYLEIS